MTAFDLASLIAETPSAMTRDQAHAHISARRRALGLDGATDAQQTAAPPGITDTHDHAAPEPVPDNAVHVPPLEPSPVPHRRRKKSPIAKHPHLTLVGSDDAT